MVLDLLLIKPNQCRCGGGGSGDDGGDRSGDDGEVEVVMMGAGGADGQGYSVVRWTESGLHVRRSGNSFPFLAL